MTFSLKSTHTCCLAYCNSIICCVFSYATDSIKQERKESPINFMSSLRVCTMSHCIVIDDTPLQTDNTITNDVTSTIEEHTEKDALRVACDHQSDILAESAKGKTT